MITFSERSISEEENLCDIITKWEEYKKIMSSKGLTLEFGIIFKKQLYINPQQDPKDPVEYDMLFHQAIVSVLRGTWATDKTTAVALAALQFLYDRDGTKHLPDEALPEIMYVPSPAPLINSREQYIPRPLFYLHTGDEWLKLIKAEVPKLKDKSKDQLERLYMAIVKQLPLYGSSVFAVQHKSTWTIPPAFTLVINANGIQFLKSDTKVVRFLSFY